MNRWTYALFGVLLLGGLVFAIGGAVPTHVSEVRWNQALTAGNDTTEGGNITALNVNTTTLTDKWASYFGNVSGTLVLDDDGTGDAVYKWTWNASSGGGEICLSRGAAFSFATPGASDATDIDSVWGFTPTDGDSGVNTFTGTCADLNFSSSSVASAPAADLKPHGQSSFETCFIHNGAAVLSTDYAFCTHINTSGTNYDGAAANYEVIVPTVVGGIDTYYFYLELN